MGLLSFKKDKEYANLPKHYKLLKQLGEGAFSVVYKALDTQDNKNYAIKIINKKHLNRKQLGNINNEIQIMKNLSHKNVLKLYHYYNYSDYCYLVLEYCNGGEIFNKIIEFTYFSEGLSRFIFLQLLDAIHYLHENNIVHRDIKPENLFFNKIPIVPNDHQQFVNSLRKSDDTNKLDEGVFKDGVGGGGIGIIKLGDFGLAKKLTPSKTTNFKNDLKTPCGTAGYTAPEVITVNQDLDKENYYSKSVDIWSLGCFLYTVLCGFPPFYDEDSNKLTMKILNGNYTFLKPWWDEISIEAKDLISKMLIINPNNRITVEEIYNHPWAKGEKLSDDYFNVNSKYENENSHDVDADIENPIEDTLAADLLALKLKSPVDSPLDTQHIENIANVDNDSLDSDDPLSDQPSPFHHPPIVYGMSNSTIQAPSDRQSGPFNHGMVSPIPINSSINSDLINSNISGNSGFSNGHTSSSAGQAYRAPLLSPRANAIKCVFNNPAMTDMNNFSNLKFTHGSIFNITEDDQVESDSPPPYETIDSGKYDSTEDFKLPSDSNSSLEQKPVESSSVKDQRYKQTVFKNFKNYTDSSDHKSSHVIGQDHHTPIIGNGRSIVNHNNDHPTAKTNDHKLSIRSSNESDSENEFDSHKKEIDTRQSSIVSSERYDFNKLNEFQLNMSDSNIISRRKSTLTRKD